MYICIFTYMVHFALSLALMECFKLAGGYFAVTQTLDRPSDLSGPQVL